MSKQSLIIAVKEADYIDRLAEYIRHSPFGEIWQLTAFTNPAALKHFIRGGYRIDSLWLSQPCLKGSLNQLVRRLQQHLLLIMASVKAFQRSCNINRCRSYCSLSLLFLCSLG